MTEVDIAYQRLHNQKVSRSTFIKPEDVVRWMGRCFQSPFVEIRTASRRQTRSIHCLKVSPAGTLCSGEPISQYEYQTWRSRHRSEGRTISSKLMKGENHAKKP
jgi:hypothetical protein